ncbi:MAG: Gfo/Idh/MocA family oxidoreductase [Rubellimicrobium sp.]|nr:Gfo/Idh/MocA family oxidoreductase [Rubellimicrobium sp.]
MSRRLRIGVVGAGIGASHIEGYQALPDMFEVVSLCDINDARRAEVAAKYNIPGQDARLEDLLSRELDFVDICTPSGLHHAQVLQAMRAGHDVVIEKPVGNCLAQVDEQIALAAETGRRACPIFQYRFGLGVQRLHHLIAKGVAGPASVATAETHWFRGDAYYGAAAWRGTFDGELGGCLTTHAIHIHDMMCELLGPIARVHARTARRVNGNETEDMAVLSLAFQSGAFGTSSVTLGSREEMSRLRVCFRDLVGESGRDPYNPGHDPWTFPHDDPAEAARIARALEDFTPLPERFAGQFHRLYHAVTEGGPLPVTLADARRSVELLTAAYWSARTGEEVALPIGPDHPFYNGWLKTMKEDHQNGRA